MLLARPTWGCHLFWRAAATLGVETGGGARGDEQLLEIGRKFGFAIRWSDRRYRAATLTDRRAVHGASPPLPILRRIPIVEPGIARMRRSPRTRRWPGS